METSQYRLTFTLLPGREWPPAPERLTWLLTHARRRCGLRCLEVEELPPPQPMNTAASDQQDGGGP